MTAYKNLSDSELIKLLQVSDHAAYTEIYNRFFPLLFLHAVKKLGDKDEAKDIIHEIFTKLWIRRESPLQATNLVGYLYTLLKNRIIDYIGHQQVEAKYISHFKSYGAIRNLSRTDALIREKEMRKYIDKEINALPPKMKAIFLLSRNDELSYKEIADKLTTTENNISKQVNNAIRILKIRLGSAIYTK